MSGSWEGKAALYELLARTFLFTEREVADALVSGEYADAMAELAVAAGLGADLGREAKEALEPYLGMDGDGVFHDLRREYTRLYVGSKDPLVTPYAGVWAAKSRGRLPLLFVGKESMEIERFMRRCGMRRVGPSNEPVDHIGSMLEFLMHLCAVKAGIVVHDAIELPDEAYGEFYEKHFIAFARAFAKETLELSEEACYATAARVLMALPETRL